MKQGIVFMKCTGILFDILKEHKKGIGAGHLITDGNWVWPDVAVYYIENYDLQIPDDFLQNLIDRKFVFTNDFKISNLEIAESAV